MRSIIVTTVFIFLVTPLYAAETCKRHVEPAGNFSICVPDGWQIKTPDQGAYKIMVGTASGPLTPNINFQDEVVSADMNLAKYIEAGKKETQRMAKEAGFTRVDLVSQSKFASDSKEPSIRIAYSSELNNIQIGTLQYTFKGTKNRMMVVTCTMPEGEKKTFTPICDRAAKSFKIER